jgi:acetyl esterase
MHCAKFNATVTKMNKEKFLRAFLNAPSLPIEDIDRARSIMNAKVERAVKVPFDGTIDDIIAETGAVETRVRIYSPAGRGPFPAILFMHGGGFCLGTPDLSDNTCRLISAAANAVLVSVDYGLAPEHKFPYALEQCYQTALWLLDNDVPLNIRTDQLAIAGDSAGGNLAAGVCLLARQRQDFSPVHQLLICPLLDYSVEHAEKLKGLQDITLSDRNSQAFRNYYLNDAEEVTHPLVSPLLTENVANLPAATIVTAGLDPLAVEAICYAKRLKQAGVAVNHRHYEGMVHDFVLFVGPLEEAEDVARELGFMVGKALRAD